MVVVEIGIHPLYTVLMNIGIHPCLEILWSPSSLVPTSCSVKVTANCRSLLYSSRGWTKGGCANPCPLQCPFNTLNQEDISAEGSFLYFPLNRWLLSVFHGHAQSGFRCYDWKSKRHNNHRHSADVCYIWVCLCGCADFCAWVAEMRIEKFYVGRPLDII